MKDIYEKLLVSLWAWLSIGIIIVCCHHAPSNEDTDDFEGEFIQPAVPILTTPQLQPQPRPQPHLVTYQGRYFSYGAKFSDRNDCHLGAAERIGLNPGPENRAEAAKMRKQLHEIQTNPNYVVEELTHSLPYLVPVAANRLDSIGAEFANILTRNNLPKYRFRVTSVLRSQEDIRRLNRCNPNSVSNSPHNYGTTFDIGYAHFDKVAQTVDSMSDDNLKLVLGQALLNQQRAGHIYVKYEYKQGCFHITARN